MAERLYQVWRPKPLSWWYVSLCSLSLEVAFLSRPTRMQWLTMVLKVSRRLRTPLVGSYGTCTALTACIKLNKPKIPFKLTNRRGNRSS
ncbi:MAG: hypothetical protein WED04_10275 [Promethearchaeati archaeon SRVP18_Atabeyarchaeia-1]